MDHVDRNLFEELAKPPLVFETRAKRRAGEGIPEPRHDAAADVDATAGPQSQRQVAGDIAEESAEQRQRLDAVRVGRSQCAPADVGGGQCGAWMAGQCR